jgi:hypothetical protein
MTIRFKCGDCRQIFTESDMGETEACPNCDGDSIWEQDLPDVGERCHMNEFGEIIPHRVTIRPDDLGSAMDRILKGLAVLQ